MATIKTGLIQVALKGDAEDSPEAIRERMIDAHVPFIEEAAAAGVQVLCFQEVFTQPYFCPSQDSRWYAATEPIPDGPTTQLMCEHARRHGMVIVVPIYEEAMLAATAPRRHRAGLPVEKKVRLAIDLCEAARAARPEWPSEAIRRQRQREPERAAVETREGHRPSPAPSRRLRHPRHHRHRRPRAAPRRSPP